eukprot:1672966-Rhodomonas_salina.2
MARGGGRLASVAEGGGWRCVVVAVGMVGWCGGRCRPDMSGGGGDLVRSVALKWHWYRPDSRSGKLLTREVADKGMIAAVWLQVRALDAARMEPLHARGARP